MERWCVHYGAAEQSAYLQGRTMEIEKLQKEKTVNKIIFGFAGVVAEYKNKLHNNV